MARDLLFAGTLRFQCADRVVKASIIAHGWPVPGAAAGGGLIIRFLFAYYGT